MSSRPACAVGRFKALPQLVLTAHRDPSSPYTTDAPSSRVLDMVKGYDEYLLPEDDAACLWGCALYIRKETTEKKSLRAVMGYSSLAHTDQIHCQ